jgi:3-deoxy-D-manno-octulosonate 8-phosphate phosphatase (KDO 8-P phosphatase)
MPYLRESFIFMTCSRQGWCRRSVNSSQWSEHRIQMRNTNTSVQAKAKKIKLLLLDVDGVLTDGRIILDNQGNELKAFHVRDGHGIKMAQRAGIVVGIITGRTAEAVNIRARELGIQEVHQGSLNKIAVYDSILSKHGLRDEAVAYMGDDVVDLDIFKRTGFAVTVADADPSVKPYVDMVTKAAGGRGAVREFINLILKHQSKLHTS